MTRMYHPEHGYIHVYDAQEQAEREKKGWVVSPEVERKKPGPKPKAKA